MIVYVRRTRRIAIFPSKIAFTSSLCECLHHVNAFTVESSIQNVSTMYSKTRSCLSISLNFAGVSQFRVSLLWYRRVQRKRETRDEKNNLTFPSGPSIPVPLIYSPHPFGRVFFSRLVISWNLPFDFFIASARHRGFPVSTREILNSRRNDISIPITFRHRDRPSSPPLTAIEVRLWGWGVSGGGSRFCSASIRHKPAD